MDKSLRTEKEIIKMRESALSDWRKDLQEEHPYVELMPSPQPKDMRELKKEMKIKAVAWSLKKLSAMLFLNDRMRWRGPAKQQKK